MEPASDGSEFRMAEGHAPVAVIIPVYNGEAFIRRALDSVLRQTYRPAQIVVVDDGSRDKTRDIVMTEYGEAVTLVQQKNGGPAKARNAGMRATTAAFVAFLDADDWWEPTKLEKQLKVFERDPDTVMNYTALRLVDEASGRHKDEVPPRPDSLWPQLRWCNPGIPPSCMMVRRSALERTGGFNERQVGCEDWCLWFELRALGRFSVCPEPLTDYRMSMGGLSGDATHMFNDFMKMLDDVLLRGLSGVKRAIWRRRIVSFQAFRAALTARASGNGAEEMRFVKKSLAAWPSPFWAPERFKAFAVTLLRSTKKSHASAKIQDV
jgi:glycosyltransferase involved in cell wall biosynthesis